MIGLLVKVWKTIFAGSVTIDIVNVLRIIMGVWISIELFWKLPGYLNGQIDNDFFFFIFMILVQIVLFLYIGSNWHNMGTAQKIFMSLLAMGGPASFVGFVAVLGVFIAIFLLIGLGPTISKSQQNYNRAMKRAELEGDIIEIRRDIDDIRSKL